MSGGKLLAVSLVSYAISFGVMGFALKHIERWINKFGTEHSYGYAYLTVLVGQLAAFGFAVVVVLVVPGLPFLANFANIVFWIWWLMKRYRTEMMGAIGIAIAVNVVTGVVSAVVSALLA